MVCDKEDWVTIKKVQSLIIVVMSISGYVNEQQETQRNWMSNQKERESGELCQSIAQEECAERWPGTVNLTSKFFLSRIYFLISNFKCLKLKENP